MQLYLIITTLSGMKDKMHFKFQVPNIFILLSFLIMIGCSKIPHENAYLNLNECSASLSPFICFDSLITDSRCPKKMECVWQGNALAKVNFHEGGNNHILILSLKGYPGFEYPSDTLINGYHITFADLLPYPGDSNLFPPKAYFVIK